MNRRSLLAGLGVPWILSPKAFSWPRALSIAAELSEHPGTADETVDDEDFWRQVQLAFPVDRSMLNLNNGGVSPSPSPVQESLARHTAFANEAPSYKMWRLLEPQREVVRTRLARHFGADPEEIAITRNSSEALQTCQMGFDLEPGDEVLCTTQDYPRMVTTFQQRERREGIVLRQFRIPTPCVDLEEVVRLYEQHLSERTRLILISHVINITGQILPVRDVVRMARKREIPVIVDGAHSFAHFPFQRDDLECDYYATSLHKWLFAPIGTGMLYVRRDKIPGLWPLMAAGEVLDDDIRKFEQSGTHPCPIVLAIANALTFHEGLGSERKAARLLWLRDRWAKRLMRHDRVHMNTSLELGRAGGIANFRVEGIDTKELQQWLWKKHRIYTIGVVKEDPWGEPEFDGLRISPSVYTTPAEIDRFCEAMEQALSQGIGD